MSKDNKFLSHPDFFFIDDSSESNSNHSEDNASGNLSALDKKAIREQRITSQNLKFLENFNPEQSNRERKKLMRKIGKNGMSVVSEDAPQTRSAGPVVNLYNFDPERRRLLRRIRNSSQVTITETVTSNTYERPEIDVCDCLDTNCSGCFFPCPKCTSPKCGPECRINRKGLFDYIEVEGRNESISNSYK